MDQQVLLVLQVLLDLLVPPALVDLEVREPLDLQVLRDRAVDQLVLLDQQVPLDSQVLPEVEPQDPLDLQVLLDQVAAQLVQQVLLEL